MGVDGQLGSRGRAGSRKDECRLVGFHVDVVAAFPGAVLQKLLPQNIASGAHGSFSRRPLQNDNVLNLVAGIAARASSTISFSRVSLPLR